MTVNTNSTEYVCMMVPVLIATLTYQKFKELGLTFRALNVLGLNEVKSYLSASDTLADEIN